MDSPGKCLRKGKSFSSSGISGTAFILCSTDRIANMFGVVSLQLLCKAGNLAYSNEKKNVIHEGKNYILEVFFWYCSRSILLHCIPCACYKLSKRGLTTQRLEILLLPILLNFFSLVSFSHFNPP